MSLTYKMSIKCRSTSEARPYHSETCSVSTEIFKITFSLCSISCTLSETRVLRLILSLFIIMYKLGEKWPCSFRNDDDWLRTIGCFVEATDANWRQNITLAFGSRWSRQEYIALLKKRVRKYPHTSYSTLSQKVKISNRYSLF